jgi:hypothetical protein
MVSVKTNICVILNILKILEKEFHPDNGGDTFLRNIGSYKSHTEIPEDGIRRHVSPLSSG